MTIDHAALERAAEVAALRMLSNTTAMLTFKQMGMTGQQVRDLGHSMAEEVKTITIEGVEEEYMEAARAANEKAVLKLFKSLGDTLDAATDDTHVAPVA